MLVRVCVHACVRAGNRQGVTYVHRRRCLCLFIMYTCVSVCMYCTYLYIYVRMYVHTYVHIHTYTYVTVNALSVCRCSVLESLTSDEVFSGNVTLRGAGGQWTCVASYAVVTPV